jgi:sensor histidine kinase YesM
MQRASAIYWVVQLIGWGVFCLLIAITTYVQGEFTKETAIRLIELYTLLIVVTHGMRYLLLKLDWLNLKLAPLIPRVLLLNITASITLLIGSSVFSYFFFGESLGRPIEIVINVLLYTIFFIMWSAVYLTYHLLRKSRKQELHNLKLIASNHEIELKTLRDQLNPHFLFNSLNSIRALIEIDPGTAKSAITTLSNILRDSLQLGKRSLIQLDEELKLVSEYLKLEKIRFEERLTYSIDCSVDKKLHIPPFLLQTMTENAIKHGISKKADGGIVDVNVYEKDDKIYLEVINSGGQYSPIDKDGIGIKNTKRRLEIQFGDKADFHIRNVDQKVSAYVWINKNELK